MIKPEDLPDHALIIDVRSADEFAYGHITGSQNIPLEEIIRHVDRLKETNKPVYLSCQSGRRAEVAKNQLEQAGVTQLFCIDGGFNGWKQAGLPITAFKTGISIMRQVQIIVGVMVLMGFFYPPLWFFAPVAGLGMLVAGLTNTCMMAVLLAKMPWNQLADSASKSCCANK